MEYPTASTPSPGQPMLPSALADLLAEGVGLVTLDPGALPSGLESAELGLLGSPEQMAGFYETYEFGIYMPGAWPFALDGGGGFFALDLRAITSSSTENAPVVWAHSGNLGWGEDEYVSVAADFNQLLAACR
ncbi:SMI1/KNR4 family protein [Kineosporia babensis]|uniref:SMI1/KNR4 family protein n=1 Tax=Kineosporia babensis TaxID=499548 RepID=A0A9X1NBL4_9ACTN|nr:SMI1/KNR4 family protein [Kineosporia babensis]MCD5311138.1 SMI1/KNR4 family protein [Kineosporia babensis]